jgi:type IV pilus biogenesis protein PilP
VGDLWRLRDQRELLEEKLKVAKLSKELRDLTDDAPVSSSSSSKSGTSGPGASATPAPKHNEPAMPQIVSILSGGHTGTVATLDLGGGAMMKVHAGSKVPNFGEIVDVSVTDGVVFRSGLTLSPGVHYAGNASANGTSVP